MSAPSVLRAAWLLARKDLLLEVRSRELAVGMGLFSLSALVLSRFAVAGGRGAISSDVASGLLWLAILLAAVLALNRVFAPERDEGLLDALLLAPVDRVAIWLSKAIAIAVLLVGVEVVAVPLTWLLLWSGAEGGTPALAPLCAGLALADVGIACVGSLLATLASAARQREVLLPLLFLPVATPLLILGVSLSVAAADGGPVGRYLGLIGLYDSLFAVLAWGSYEHVITE